MRDTVQSTLLPTTPNFVLAASRFPGANWIALTAKETVSTFALGATLDTSRCVYSLLAITRSALSNTRRCRAFQKGRLQRSKVGSSSAPCARMTSGRTPARYAINPSGYQTPQIVVRGTAEAWRVCFRNHWNARHSRTGRRESTRIFANPASGIGGMQSWVRTRALKWPRSNVSPIPPHSLAIPPETGGYSNANRRSSHWLDAVIEKSSGFTKESLAAHRRGLYRMA